MPGLITSAPVDMDWDNVEGVLNINATQDTKLTLDLTKASEVTFEGKKVQAQGRPITISLSAGKHILTGIFMPDVLKNTFIGTDKFLEKTPRLRARRPSGDIPEDLPALTQNFKTSFPESITQMISVGEDPLVRYYVAAGKFVYLLDATGKISRRFAASTNVTKIHWWPQAKLLLVGTQGQKVLAFRENGTLRWTFQSEMDPAVYAAGKTYWFNTAPGHGGIHGLDSGIFIDQQSQLFVGSACTLEILDSNGSLIKRLPQFWGPPALFQLIPAADNSVNLLASRDITDGPRPHIINSKTMDPNPRGFYSVPSDFTYVSGWVDQRRMHYFYVDLNGDGKKAIVSDIVGIWNRISTWDLEGNPLSSIYFGPGDSPYRGRNTFAPTLIRDTDVADIDGDGKADIITALAKGLILLLDGQCRIKWSRRINGVPTAVKIVGQTIVIGQENGTITTFDGGGTFLSQTKAGGSVNDLLSHSGNSVIVVNDRGVEGFKVP